MKQIDNNTQIISDTPFPKLISLGHCDLDVTKQYEKYVFKALKSFSKKEDFDSRTPHPLHKSPSIEKYFTIAKSLKPNSPPKVMSLDVKSRNDTKRLFYCEDTNNVCHILALCSEETH